MLRRLARQVAIDCFKLELLGGFLWSTGLWPVRDSRAMLTPDPRKIAVNQVVGNDATELCESVSKIE